MATGELTLVEILVWPVLIFLGLLVLTVLVLLAWVRYAQKKSNVELDQIRKSLRQFQTNSSQARSINQRFTPDDPDPYGPLVKRLVSRLEDMENQTRYLFQRYGEVREDIKAASFNDWHSIFRLPYDWYNIRHQVNELRSEVKDMEGESNQVYELIHKIETLGWEVACHARKVLEDNRSAVKVLTGLNASEIKDRLLDDCIAEGKGWEKTLSTRVPVYFLSADEATILGQADKTTIANVHHTLREARPAIDDLLSKAKTWESQHQRLKQTLKELADSFRQVSADFSALESGPVHPINWDKSRDTLSGARQRIEAIGAGQKTRTLDQEQKDLENANTLIARIKDLAGRHQQAAAKHQELLALLETPEIKQREEWYYNTQKLVKQVEDYDPENWPRVLAVQDLPEELQALSEYQGRLHLGSAEEPIKESELPKIVEDTARLAEIYKSIRPRASDIQARLAEIKETERNTRDALMRTRALLNQAESLAGSNPILSKSASGELSQLLESIDFLLDELNQPGHGAIDKKAQRINTVIRKAEQASNQWLDQLAADLENRKASIAERVNLLDQIAHLSDPVIAEAKKLVASIEDGQPSGRHRPKSQLPFSEVITEIKAKNDEWHRCGSILRTIDDFQKPIIDRYEKADEQRAHAEEQLARAIEVIPEGRAWPPTTQVIASERRQFNLLEERWAAMGKEPAMAIELVSKLSDLSEDYQSLAGKLSQTIERADQEQDRVRELEARLDESKSLWQYHLNAYSDNPTARDEIDLLLEGIDQEMDMIRQRFMRGSIPYNQAIQNIRMLCQKLDGAQIPVDSRQTIDINGVVQKRI